MRIERATRWPAVPRWAVLIVALYLLLVGLHEVVGPASGVEAGPLCLFRRLTGHPCPGCGTTRAVLAALGGRFAEATAWNPLMFGLAMIAVILLAIRLILRRRVVWITSARSVRMFALALVLLVLGNWIYILAVA